MYACKEGKEGTTMSWVSQMCEMCSCWPLGRKTGKARQQFGEAQRERGDLSSAETLSVKGRYGRDMLIDPWTKHCAHAHKHTHCNPKHPKIQLLHLKGDPETSQSWEKKNVDGVNSMKLQMCAWGVEKIAVYVTC